MTSETREGLKFAEMGTKHVLSLSREDPSRLQMPMPERRMIDKPLANRRPAGGFDHLGVEGGLIDEDQAVQGLAHEGLAAGDPDATRQRHVRPVLLGGEQCFLWLSPRR